MNLCTTLHYKKSKMGSYGCILKNIGCHLKYQDESETSIFALNVIDILLIMAVMAILWRIVNGYQ